MHLAQDKFLIVIKPSLITTYSKCECDPRWADFSSDECNLKIMKHCKTRLTTTVNRGTRRDVKTLTVLEVIH